ncbi:DUF262 domain-containing protein [Corynebacterium hansenii]|uniref:DUF262 domain-containing protein n=1 Tax=Corynebacterium hansenii TaxID=394964 RepID=A0ABV7ZKR0_9CORY|nr:DUF262 domain-containing protein [Corynebacterium hansenii]WJY99434.1 hypothetical protein CHAN_04055 [Corynebacterium hansenii]
MGFETPQYPLSDLLRKVETGEIQLPDFQRGYKWDEERIRALLITVLRGYPMGSLMALDTANSMVRFKPRPITGAPPEAAKNEPSLLILDGQQRLTSLFQSLWGDGIVETETDRRKKVQRRYFLDLNKALESEEIPDDAVFMTPPDGVIRSNFNRDIDLDLSTEDKWIEHLCVPMSSIFSGTIHSVLAKVAASEGNAELQTKFSNRIMNPLMQYRLPAIKLDRETPKGAVATVFEKVNTGGLPLNVFELLTATFAGDGDYFEEHGHDFRLVDDWKKTEEILRSSPVLEYVGRSEFLTAVTLLVNHDRPGRTSARREDILRLDLRDYVAAADRIRGALKWVAAFLKRNRIHTAFDIPYGTQLIPLLTIRAILGERADIHGVFERISQWYWCGVLGEMYGSTTETRFAWDVDEVPEWATDETGEVPLPHTIKQSSFVESRLVSLKTRNAAAYKGIYALLMQHECQDWATARNFNDATFLDLDVDIHHVFPRKWCDDKGIDPHLRDSIVNKTPLGRATNIAIGGSSPQDYVPKLEKRARLDSEKLDAIIASHQIAPETLRNADFVSFFTDRRRRILALVEAAMGKPAQRDIDDTELLGGLEGPAEFEEENGDTTSPTLPV